MTQGSPFESFVGRGYISLETFRKSGAGVRTPVWFAESGLDTPVPLFYVYTIGDSGKAKRIRNNSRVRIAPCDMRGKVFGEARAEILQGEVAAKACARSIGNMRRGISR
jgi:PPOX class probable F420-dependent enzyme